MTTGPSPDGDGTLLNAGGKIDSASLQELYEKRSDDDDAPISATFTLSRDLAKRLDHYLRDRIPFLSRTSLQSLIREHAVTVNGRHPKASTKLRRGDVVTVILPPPPSRDIIAQEIELTVVHEDDDLIVINKQDDIIVHPARAHRSGTMINALAWRFQYAGAADDGLSDVGREHARPGVVHRLDRHTTGVMVFAKSDIAHWRLGKQFENRTIAKRYLAVVHGELEPMADVIDLPLGRHPTVREKNAVRWDETGKASVTLYRVRERYEGFTLVELELRTGRTHQIRIHLAHLGYPIVGDDMYGGRHVTVGDIVPPSRRGGLSGKSPVMSRQALHATLLGFCHPKSEEMMEFQAPVHRDMHGLITLLREVRFTSAPKVAGAVLDLDAVIPSQS